MDILKHLFLEDPLSLWIGLALAEIVTLIVWRQSRSRRAAVGLAAFPAAAIAVGLLAWAVETDYERLVRTLDVMARAVDTGDAEALIERVSPDYQPASPRGVNGRARREDLAAVVRLGLRHVRATAATPTIQWEDGRAVVRQTYLFRPAPGSRFDAGQAFRDVVWEGVFQPDADREWRLRSAAAIRPVRVTPEEGVRYLPR
jgi:hypothetical protein